MQRPVWWLRLVAALPLRTLYALAAVIAWVTWRVVPYRSDVVRENLRIAFPEADEAQLREIAATKLADLNANDVDAAAKIIAGTARSMGVDVVG